MRVLQQVQDDWDARYGAGPFPAGRSIDAEREAMRENRIRSLWARDEAVVNGWLAIPNSFSAETMAHAGWDLLTLDMQHGVVDYQSAVAMLTAISTTQTMPVVRVPWLDPGIIMKMLDAGAYAIICPMVSTRADAEKLVTAMRYPPQGSRSFGPIRASLYAGADYAKHANDLVVALRHDRDTAGARQSRRDPLGRRDWMPSISARPISRSPSAARRDSTRTKSRWSRRST